MRHRGPRVAESALRDVRRSSRASARRLHSRTGARKRVLEPRPHPLDLSDRIGVTSHYPAGHSCRYSVQRSRRRVFRRSPLRDVQSVSVAPAIGGESDGRRGMGSSSVSAATSFLSSATSKAASARAVLLSNPGSSKLSDRLDHRGQRTSKSQNENDDSERPGKAEIAVEATASSPSPIRTRASILLTPEHARRGIRPGSIEPIRQPTVRVGAPHSRADLGGLPVRMETRHGR